MGHAGDELINPIVAPSLKDHIVHTYGELLKRIDKLERSEYNINMDIDNELIDSIIATVRFGDPKHLRNDLKAIVELAIQRSRE